GQPYHYLAKGCQAYVFASQDGLYVLKLFKFKRFHDPFLWNELSFIPFVDRHLQAKRKQKLQTLNSSLQAWKVAINELKEESGLMYVHLNPSKSLHKPLVFYDKIGLRHTLEADDTVFMIQRKAETLTHWIKRKLSQ